MRVSIASEPATPGAVNLDWAGAFPRLAVVLDGLTESPQTGCVHGTAWYVARLGARLLRRLDGPTPLADGLALAIEEVAAEHPRCDLRHPGSPGSTVSIVRQTPQGAEYLVLADSPVVLDAADGPVAVVDDSWKALATPHLAAAADRGTRDDLARFITDQQSQRNTPGGYWIARTEPEAAAHALTGTVPDVHGAVLASDGAALLVTDYARLDWRGYLDLAYREGPAGIITSTRAAEHTDPDRTRWPRQKVSDDATAAVCLFDTTRQKGAQP
ncbi:protein phosphatase 2C domain-containing protein [Catellatospora citrea]|nr:protein phosphatase 2C domain-containing protein [Catellatospora citrea]RKE07451.1 protein phosphatase 2C-like protein [Catellatospora citrea]